MMRRIVGAVVVVSCMLVPGAAGAEGFSGSGAAGYAQSQGWTASPGVRPRSARGRPTPTSPRRDVDHPVRGR